VRAFGRGVIVGALVLGPAAGLVGVVVLLHKFLSEGSDHRRRVADNGDSDGRHGSSAVHRPLHQTRQTTHDNRGRKVVLKGRTRKIIAATIAALLVAAATSFAAYVTLITGSGSATSQLGTTQPTANVTLHFSFNAANLVPGATVPLTGPGANGGITADVAGGGTTTVNGIELGSITTSDPTHCLPSWFSVSGLPVDSATNGAFPKQIAGSGYELLPPGQGVGGQLPQLTFNDDGSTDQDACRIGSGTSANPDPDTVTVTLVPF